MSAIFSFVAGRLPWLNLWGSKSGDYLELWGTKAGARLRGWGSRKGY